MPCGHWPDGSMSIPIVYLITELDTGGAQKVLLQLLSRLDRRRFSPSVVCLYNGDKAVAQEIRSLGIHVADLGMATKWRVDAFWRFLRLLRAERPAILHTHLFHANIPGRVVGRLTGVPIVISTEHSMGTESGWRYRLNRLTHPLADRVVCVSQQIAGFFTQRVGIPEAKVVVIPNGIDPERFRHLPDKRVARAGLGLPAGGALIGTVARLHPVKNLPVLLEAVAMLPEVSLVVVGDGPERTRLVRLAVELGLQQRVQFVGQQRDVLPWLAACDLFALPSESEGLSMAILEAMAAALPVVATRVGGTPELVMDQVTGRLVPSGDPRPLAQAIGSLVGDPGLRHKMGRAGAERVAAVFSLDRMVGDTVCLYNRLLAEKDHRLRRWESAL
jgi:sugar transferase (PEP-CTERM/EpsH1 system associated)